MIKVIAISGPSGTGKTTLVHRIMDVFPSLEFSVSATTRPKRLMETEGVDYYFLSNPEFQKKLEEGAFVEYQQVYKNIFYGSLKTEIDRISNMSKIALLDIDVMGALNIKKYYKDEALLIFIHPGSIELLKKRLIARGTDDGESLGKRLGKAELEISYATKFDEIVLNNEELDTSVQRLTTVLKQYN